MKTKMLLLVLAVALTGCNDLKPIKGAKVYRPEVEVRRAELVIELVKKRSAWAEMCVREDLKSECNRFAIDLFPDMTTEQLTVEFHGDLYIDEKEVTNAD